MVRIKLKDVPKTTLILPYVITIFYLICFVSLFFVKDTVPQTVFGLIVIIGFINILLRGKNLKNLKIGLSGIEISYPDNKQRRHKKL